MKTEKQKAAEGLLYDANNDPQLQQEMLETRCLLHEYNLPLQRPAERKNVIYQTRCQEPYNASGTFFVDFL